jgi:hypothetical protein
VRQLPQPVGGQVAAVVLLEDFDLNAECGVAAGTVSHSALRTPNSRRCQAMWTLPGSPCGRLSRDGRAAYLRSVTVSSTGRVTARLVGV